MNQEKINQVIALFAAGDPRFLDAFRAIESQLSTAEHWQLLQLISGELDKSVSLAEKTKLTAKAA